MLSIFRNVLTRAIVQNGLPAAESWWSWLRETPREHHLVFSNLSFPQTRLSLLPSRSFSLYWDSWLAIWGMLCGWDLHWQRPDRNFQMSVNLKIQIPSRTSFASPDRKKPLLERGPQSDPDTSGRTAVCFLSVQTLDLQSDRSRENADVAQTTSE